LEKKRKKKERKEKGKRCREVPRRRTQKMWLPSDSVAAAQRRKKEKVKQKVPIGKKHKKQRRPASDSLTQEKILTK